jgi:hypothetical protein
MATRTLGQRTVPFLIDDNSRMVKQEIFTADRIIDYLFDSCQWIVTEFLNDFYMC